jgi:hypothetical protein
MTPESKHRELTTIRAAAYETLFGCTPVMAWPYRELGDSSEDGIFIDVFAYTLEGPDGDLVAAVTNGMSNRRMVDPEDPTLFSRRELIQYFRTCTNAHAKRLRDMAWLPLFDKFLLDSHHSIAWEWSALEGTPWKNAFFLEPIIRPHQAFSVPIEGDDMSFLWHIPISDAERDFKREHGSNALLDRMSEVKLPWIFDETNRPSLV